MGLCAEIEKGKGHVLYLFRITVPQVRGKIRINSFRKGKAKKKEVLESQYLMVSGLFVSFRFFKNFNGKLPESWTFSRIVENYPYSGK